MKIQPYWQQKQNKQVVLNDEQTKFKGGCDQFVGAIFDIVPNQAYYYMKNDKEIIDYYRRIHAVAVYKLIKKWNSEVT